MENFYDKLNNSHWATDGGKNLDVLTDMVKISRPRNVTETVIDVKRSYRTQFGDVVYLIAIHKPDCAGAVSDMLTKDKTGMWTAMDAGFCFMPPFVRAYTSSIYGHHNVADLQTARELAWFLDCEDRIISLGKYALRLIAGGITISEINLTKNVLKNALNFVPYESFDRDEIKDVYAMVLRYYTTDEEIDGEKIPDTLIYKVFELGYPEGLKELEEINKRENKTRL